MLPADDSAIRRRALEVHERLVGLYGEPRPSPRDPIATLVLTILSQNTNDRNRDRAFSRLRERFSTWEAVLAADVDEIKDAIRTAGLADQKARTIKRALAHIVACRCHLELDFLREMSVPEALDWLTAIRGVGPKTAAIVLLFALGMPAFPVDTHVHRVSMRLGLIPARSGRERAHVVLADLLPPELYYPFHINLIRHGRAVCTARKPRCANCTLRDLCPTAQDRTL